MNRGIGNCTMGVGMVHKCVNFYGFTGIQFVYNPALFVLLPIDTLTYMSQTTHKYNATDDFHFVVLTLNQ